MGRISDVMTRTRGPHWAAAAPDSITSSQSVHEHLTRQFSTASTVYVILVRFGSYKLFMGEKGQKANFPSLRTKKSIQLNNEHTLTTTDMCK